MHGDFSSVTFDSLDRFSAVVALQGRISVEADQNEQTAIVQHYLRTLVTDLLGAHAWPTENAGFDITPVPAADVGLKISKGRCYVDGMLVENPGEVSFFDQPDARFAPSQHALPKTFPYFAYLEVCERLVTFVEQPSIRDVALGVGGPDSSARSKVVWQVRYKDQLPGDVPTDVDGALGWWADNVAPALLDERSGQLTAAVSAGKEDELCALAPDAGFRGIENQLYRVEIHESGRLNGDGGAPMPSFKWSRDNGSVVFPVTGAPGEPILALANLGRDDRYALDVGDRVELVDDASALNREPLALRKVMAVDPVKLLVTLDAAPERVFGSNPERHPFIRRWDHQPPLTSDGAGHAIRFTVGPVTLEDGIVVVFSPGNYRTGDYWVFPARVETGSIEWPMKDGKALPRLPDGVQRSYVPLALVQSQSTRLDLRAPKFSPRSTGP